MNKLLMVTALTALSVQAHAAEYGHVVSSTPVLQQVQVPQRSCWDEQVVVQQPRSAGGAIVGGIAGGVLGSTIGKGGGKMAATAIGAVTGAVVGDRIDNQDGQTTTQTVRRCQTTQTSQQRTLGYDVTYEYAGQRYTTRMNNDPGEWVPIVVSVEGTTPAPASTTIVETQAAPATTYIEQGPVVVYRRPAVIWGPSIYFGFGHSYHRHGRHW
ncbi:MAG: 17 kDa surface antigen [Rhodocyclales bacterium]|nr:17 kDa surface antigen [Rhodocyclales bacterium]